LFLSLHSEKTIVIIISFLGRLCDGIETTLSEKLIHHGEEKVHNDERKARDNECTADIIKAIRIFLSQPINNGLGAIFLVLLAKTCRHENS
jgi:hypothetical protein